MWWATIRSVLWSSYCGTVLLPFCSACSPFWSIRLFGLFACFALCLLLTDSFRLDFSFQAFHWTSVTGDYWMGSPGQYLSEESEMSFSHSLATRWQFIRPQFTDVSVSFEVPDFSTGLIKRMFAEQFSAKVEHVQRWTSKSVHFRIWKSW